MTGRRDHRGHRAFELAGRADHQAPKLSARGARRSRAARLICAADLAPQRHLDPIASTSSDVGCRVGLRQGINLYVCAGLARLQ